MKSAYLKKIQEDFQRDGYIFLPGFLNIEETANLNKRVEDYIGKIVPGMPLNHVFYENKNDPATLKQLQDMHSYDPFFAAFLYKSKFEEIAEILIGEKVIGKTIEYFNKLPAIGQPTPPHQDAYYFMLKPPKALTMWLALEHVDIENGCVRYIKGSHLQGMRPHGKSNVTGFSQGITNYDKQDFATEVPVAAMPGDLLVHHSMTIHRADANTSKTRSRKALGFIYFGESAEEDLEAKKVYQKKLAEESSKTA